MPGGVTPPGSAGTAQVARPGLRTPSVDVRERLRRSKRPDRIFEVGLEAARAAGLVNRRRVLDSTPLYDAVATMDTVTLIRSAVRGLLTAADAELEAELRAVLSRGGTKCGYPATGGPHACESCAPCGGGPDTRPRPRRAGRSAAGGRVRRRGEVAPFSCRSRSTRTASCIRTPGPGRRQGCQPTVRWLDRTSLHKRRRPACRHPRRCPRGAPVAAECRCRDRVDVLLVGPNHADRLGQFGQVGCRRFRSGQNSLLPEKLSFLLSGSDCPSR
jgi:hypothetical protein